MNAEEIVTMPVVKYFPGHGTFHGRVHSYDGEYFRVKYEDGDEEDVDCSELTDMIPFRARCRVHRFSLSENCMMNLRGTEEHREREIERLRSDYNRRW